MALLALPGVASATPTSRVQIARRADPGLPAHGQHPRRRRCRETEYQISGTEYLGSPPPVIGVNVYLPKGSILHTTGFPTCTTATLEQFGPVKCPKGSSAGPTGKVARLRDVRRRTRDRGSGTVVVLLAGRRDRVLHRRPLAGVAGNPVQRPLHQPRRRRRLRPRGRSAGAARARACPARRTRRSRSIKVKFGSAYKSHGKTIYYGRVPKKCPKGGFPIKTEVIFAENGEESKPVTVDARHTRRRARQEVAPASIA